MGCGSGLVGAEISDDKICLTGVDLSEKMLEIANRKKLYNELHCDDIQQYLFKVKGTRKFDLIYACSVIQFFDDVKFENLMVLHTGEFVY